MASNDHSDSWLKGDNFDVTSPPTSTPNVSSADLESEMQVASSHQMHATSGRKRKILIYGVIFLAVVGIVVGIVVGVSASQSVKKSVTNPVAAPTPTAPTTPGPTPTSASEVGRVVMNNARFGGNEFDDANSYQSQAMTWVLTQEVPAEGIELSMEEQALQLYALACIYYSTYSAPNAWTNFHFGVGVALPGWFSNRGWLGSSREVCTWHGITCNADSRVEKIELDTNGLTGTLPPETALLFGSLTYLDLYNNLIHNKGDEGNAWLGELVNLEYLFYGTTSFEYDGVPTEIGLLTKLKEYDFSYSLYFGELPSGMWSGLSDLDYLVMDGNAYNSSLPQDLVELPNLQYLYASFCFLDDDLDFVSQMPKIFELWIDDNPSLSGSIPPSIAETDTLVSLSVTNCDLTGAIPTEFGLMSDMIQLWVYDNNLTGTIPTELGNLKKLKVLEVHKNFLTGEMPSDLCTRRAPFGRLEELRADCDSAITCDEDCCTCCEGGEECI
jgi:hypothetical protein